jgi:hypothetical protein
VKKDKKTPAELKALLAQIDPRSLTLAQLRPFAGAYQSKKLRGRLVRPRIELPCVDCARPLSARERRYACPDCGSRRNRNLSTTPTKGGRDRQQPKHKTTGRRKKDAKG